MQATLYPIENKGLFSNHFLKHQLKDDTEWKGLTNLEGMYGQISSLYEGKKNMLSKANESQLRSEFLDHILKYLNHHFAIEGAIKGTAKRPDYGLFPSVESANEAQVKQAEGFYNNAIGICEAKQWGVRLDERDVISGGIDKRTPNRQIDEYLHRSEVKWGILTNGRLWRIYYRENSYRNYYFQIDLAQTIESKDMETFKYFVLFFKREAFLPDTNNLCFLDRVYKGSIDYSKEIGENIQENVYKAMKVLAEGFIDWKENKLSKSEETLRSVQDNTMILLYRLLFIYFAEANDLLDVRGATNASTNYRNNYSLDALKKNIRNKLENGGNIPLYQAEYWGKLQTLFKFIDKGTEAMGIPRDELYIPSYNGGLFDTKRYSFLSRYKINDMSLSHAILLLSCPKGPLGLDRGFFDYSSLDIRHLGSIYEGLLEYKLKMAEEPMLAVKQKGKEIWTPKKDFQGKKYLDLKVEGDLYLTTNKGERKATGSYYTPEYIVKYIVKNTVWPVAKRKIKEAEGEDKKCSDAVLSIKVLDPAMGSGHFLVEVVDFLAMVLGDAINRDIEKGMMEEGEYPDDWLRREIVSHCVYGVDLNPMAVELAKVALWLKSISKDKPLSFLDHRLKCGNSLIGAKLVDLAWLPTQRPKGIIGQLDKPRGLVEKIINQLNEIENLSDDSIEHLKKKEKLFNELRKSDEYQRVKSLADVHTGLCFIDIDFSKTTNKWYQELVNEAYFGNTKKWDRKFAHSRARIARSESRNRYFFHWEIEFPEVFFEEGTIKENSGFDAVIGNPPYDVLADKELGFSVAKDKKFFKMTNYYYPASDKKLNLYRLFLVQGINLTKRKGKFSYIIPMALLADNQATRTRKWIYNNFQIDKIEAFPQKDNPYDRVFFEAKLPTTTIILTKVSPHEDTVVITHPGKMFEEVSKQFNYYFENLKLLDPQSLSIPLLSDEEWDICKRVFFSEKVIKLGEKFTSHQGEINETTMKKYLTNNLKYPIILRGGVVQRYELLNKPKQGVEYRLNLDEYYQGVSDRTRKAHINSWRLGYQRNAALDNWRRIIATLIPPENHFFDSISYLLPGDEIFFLLAILNSNLMEFRFRLTSTNNHVNGYEIEALPLREIYFTTPPHLRKELNGKAVSLYSTFLTSGDHEPLLSFISDRLSQEPEQSDVVHDLLAYLAERMIEMNKEKQKEIRGFLKWLEGEIGIKADDMSLKTKIRDYHKSDWDEFLKALKRNKKKITVMDITRRAPQEKIREEFDASVRKLTPLLKRIEATDRLIDRIVYRLYGLTEEEVEIIEKQQSI